MNFMRLPDEYASGSFVVLQIPFEGAVTYGDGAALGPAAIISAAEHLEYYDEQFDVEPFTKGIELLPPIEVTKSQEETVERVSKEIAKHKDKFVVALGGDHSVTIGCVRGLEESHEEFSVLSFDAHADFRYSWNGSRENHACIIRNISTKHSCGIVGVRAMDVDEAKEISDAENVHMIKAYEFSKEKFATLLGKLHKNVYVSIDVDVFDSAFIRNTGTPEPGGFMWDQLISMLAEVFKEKNVIGADIVEFAPKENYRAEAFALAKLTYKLFALTMDPSRNS